MSAGGNMHPVGLDLDDEPFGAHYLIEYVENIDAYRKTGYHPVALRDCFCDGRYEIVHKLGYGGYSTLWLARDHQLSKYVAIKINQAMVEDDHEQRINEHLTSILLDDETGKRLLSTIMDSFKIDGPNGTHKCLVMEPGRMNLFEAKDDSVSYHYVFQQEVHRAVMGQIVQAVAKLHENGIVHGDLHSSNFVFHLPYSIDHLSIEQLYEKFGEPTIEPLQRCDGGEIRPGIPKEVYLSAWLGVAAEKLPVEEAGLFLCDFGESYFPSETKRDYTNTLKLNRPPEARFSDVPLSFPSDIWTLGCLLFKTISPGPLFRTYFEDPEVITSQHVQVCGKLPEEWWQKWDARAKFFDEEGNWIVEEERTESMDFRFELSCQEAREDQEEELICEEEKKDFLDVLRRMIVLKPEERATIQEIMESEWYLKWLVPAVAKVQTSLTEWPAGYPPPPTPPSSRRESTTPTSTAKSSEEDHVVISFKEEENVSNETMVLTLEARAGLHTTMQSVEGGRSMALASPKEEPVVSCSDEGMEDVEIGNQSASITPRQSRAVRRWWFKLWRSLKQNLKLFF